MIWLIPKISADPPRRAVFETLLAQDHSAENCAPPCRPTVRWGAPTKVVALIPLPSTGSGQIEATQRQRQLLAVVAGAGSVRTRPAKGPGLESLDTKPIAARFPEQDLDPVPATVAENIETAAQWVLTEILAHQRRQSVEGFAQVRGRGGQIDRRRAQPADPDWASKTWSNRRSCSGSKPAGIRNARPPGQHTVNSPPSSGSSTCTGINPGPVRSRRGSHPLLRMLMAVAWAVFPRRKLA